MMNADRPHKSLTIGLYLVAALLAANLVATLSRNDAPSLLSAAYAQRQAPIAGGAGLFVMPAQLSGNTWGCYLLDVDRGTLGVYQFFPGSKQLQFIASRYLNHDRGLQNYNTTPSPRDVADLVEREAKGLRANQPAPEEPAPQN